MKYFFFSIFFIVLISFIVVYIKISNVNINQQKIPEKQKIEKIETNPILKVLADTKIENIFPAKELYLKVNLDYIPKTKILYQTIINKLNKYQIFGIEQILELNNIRYSIIKSENNLKLFVNFDKKSDAIKIQNLFKNYGFNVKLKRVIIKG